MSRPSPRTRLAALDALARVLRGDRPPDVDWPGVVALARELDVRAALWAAVRDDLTGLPVDAVDALRDFARGNALRNARLRRQLGQAVDALDAAGVEPLLIKGAVRLVDGTLPRIGDRWLGDLDLVVPRESEAAAEAALRAIGYRPIGGRPFLAPHDAPLAKPGEPAPIELHVELGTPPIPALLPARTTWDASEPLDALRARRPSATDQVLHSILHSALQDFNHVDGGLPLRQLVDLAALVDAHGTAVDWPAVHRRAASHGLESALAAHLWLAHRYAGLAPLPVPWWRPQRLHDRKVRLNLALGDTAAVRRNLRYAFDRAYLESRYAHHDRPVALALARVRHAGRLLRGDPRAVARQATLRRN